MRQLFATCLLTLHASVLLAQDAQGKPGAGIYATHCVACHQPDGQGRPAWRRHWRAMSGGTPAARKAATTWPGCRSPAWSAA
ncbi:c-type cytochrome [Dechloromonas sp. A34]|uniref:c-type cytochrome n=1 Tax=Dechloromonas sp. A34 TaxID=447588 RepID=UPI003A520FDD